VVVWLVLDIADWPRRICGSGIDGQQVIGMSVKCYNCEFVDQKPSIVYTSQNGQPAFMYRAPYYSAFRCIRCGSKNVVPYYQ
jgi:hypothetical protein